MSNILNTEEEVRNFLLSSPVEDVDPSAHLFVSVIKAWFKNDWNQGNFRRKTFHQFDQLEMG